MQLWVCACSKSCVLWVSTQRHLNQTRKEAKRQRGQGYPISREMSPHKRGKDRSDDDSDDERCEKNASER